MGSAVKSVAKSPTKGVVAMVDPLNFSGKGVGAVGKGVLNTATGKYEIPEGYNAQEAAYQNSQRQNEFQDLLRSRALGLAPDSTSLAQQQLKQGTSRNIAQIAGLAAGQRANQGLALRQAFNAQGAANQEAANQAAMLRAQEQLAAQSAYAADLGRQEKSAQALQELKSGIAKNTQGLEAQAEAAHAKGKQELFQSGAKAVMSLFSDESLKKDIKDADPKMIEEFASKLKAKKFKYKSPNGESYQDGESTGIIAQDLEKSKLGKAMVVDSPEGKMVDLKKAVPATMAAVSHIMERIKKLEGSKES